jgi:hypothetical protein
VRGRAVTKHQLDLGQDTFPILNNLVRPEAHDAPAFALHRRCATRVCLDLESVVVAVDLDDELPGTQAKSAK